MGDVAHVAGAHAADLVEADPQPLLNGAAAGGLVQLADLAPDGVELVLAGALPADHALAAALVADVERHAGEAMAWVERVLSEVPGAHPMDGYADVSGGRLQPSQVVVDRVGLPASVAEDGGVDPVQAASDRHEQHARGLDAGAKGQDPKRRGHAANASWIRSTSAVATGGVTALPACLVFSRLLPCRV